MFAHANVIDFISYRAWRDISQCVIAHEYINFPLSFEFAVEIYEEFVYNKYSREFMTERRFEMPNIKPVSDLRNYNEVLRDIAVGEPVFLTKNGRGRYAIVDMEEFEKTQATLKLMSELTKGDASAREKGYIDISDVEALLGVSDGRD